MMRVRGKLVEVHLQDLLSPLLHRPAQSGPNHLRQLREQFPLLKETHCNFNETNIPYVFINNEILVV